MTRCQVQRQIHALRSRRRQLHLIGLKGSDLVLVRVGVVGHSRARVDDHRPWHLLACGGQDQLERYDRVGLRAKLGHERLIGVIYLRAPARLRA
eukprot:scaffold111945_cov31-Tisochrysis_lutea.AAC.2